MSTTLRWHGYRYMPYEKRLAALEVERLTNTKPEPVAGGLRVPCRLGASVAKRLTYFTETIGPTGVPVLTDQARFEASARRSGVGPNHRSSEGPASIRLATKQTTRYSAHGLHEYRGKFNPQMVRAATNILRVKAGSLLLDPFCGSGTVLLEAAHLGFDAAGFDLHPLAVEIANAKVAAHDTGRSVFQRAANAVADRIKPLASVDDPRRLSQLLKRELPVPWHTILPNAAYLRGWFPESVLEQLAFALWLIDREVPNKLRSVFRVMLSDIVREVSWQEPSDLRIRRRDIEADNYAALPLFAEGLAKKANAICAMPRREVCGTHQTAILTDSRDAGGAAESLRRAFGDRGVDAVVSSPPYANALPYVDMHRLSLCLLGLITDRQIRESERALIGNREITDRERCAFEMRLRANSGGLPAFCHELCLSMLAKAEKPGNGFRRRNTPALLYKYLEEMQATFVSVSRLMKKAAPLAFVIGPNRCSLGGEEFAIDTPALLRAVAEIAGFEFDECIELDAYQRYSLHQQNSIRREVLLIMRCR